MSDPDNNIETFVPRPVRRGRPPKAVTLGQRMLALEGTAKALARLARMPSYNKDAHLWLLQVAAEADYEERALQAELAVVTAMRQYAFNACRELRELKGKQLNAARDVKLRSIEEIAALIGQMRDALEEPAKS